MHSCFGKSMLYAFVVRLSRYKTVFDLFFFFFSRPIFLDFCSKVCRNFVIHPRRWPRQFMTEGLSSGFLGTFRLFGRTTEFLKRRSTSRSVHTFELARAVVPSANRVPATCAHVSTVQARSPDALSPHPFRAHVTGRRSSRPPPYKRRIRTFRRPRKKKFKKRNEFTESSSSANITIRHFGSSELYKQPTDV